jgi:hypothetical protein
LYLKVKVRKLPTVHQFCRQILTFVLLFSSEIVLPVGAHIVFAQQSVSGITAPGSGEIVSGVVEVRGTAVHSDFLRFELSFWQEVNSGAEWIVFAEGDQPVQDGILALWDTTAGRNSGIPIFPDGRYRLRLRVVKTDYNYDEYFVSELTVLNEGPTPTSTPDETTVLATATAAAINLTIAANDNSSFVERTPIPSLTPFPTPTPLATAVRPINDDVQMTDTNGGLLEQITSVDTVRFRHAFLIGIQIAAGLFGTLAAYLIIRKVARWIWRRLWRQKKPKH